MNEPILHGIPRHDFFSIALPPSLIKASADALDPGYIKPILHLKDPKSGELINAEVNGVWEFNIQEFDLYNAFSLLCYGLESRKLLNVLCRRYPEIQQRKIVRFVLLRKLPL